MKSANTFALFAVSALLACSGCWRSTDAPAVVQFDTGPDLMLTVDDGEVRITPAGADTPANNRTPEDVPVFGKEPFQLETRSSTGQFGTLHVADSPAEVLRFYAAQLPVQGWQVDDQTTSGDTHTLTASKDDQALIVFIDGDEGDTTITISHSRN